MNASHFTIPRDGIHLFVRSYQPDGAPTAVVQIAHGMAEHGGRYERLAHVLTEHGYAVYASDHRGHGKTADDPALLGHFADQDGWRKVVEDQIALLDEIRSRHPGVPAVLLGHSMGSYIARGVAIRRGEALAGLCVSGTSHDHPLVYRGARYIATVERARLGKRGKSAVIRRLTFDAFNERIANPRTQHDWISRDAAEVDAYCADAHCGFECTTQLWYDVFTGLMEICAPEQLAKMPRALPICVLAGELDAIHGELAGIQKLQAALSKAKMSSVTVRIYAEARHEVFNEINRDEVTGHLLSWLETTVRSECAKLVE